MEERGSVFPGSHWDFPQAGEVETHTLTRQVLKPTTLSPSPTGSGSSWLSQAIWFCIDLHYV